MLPLINLLPILLVSPLEPKYVIPMDVPISSMNDAVPQGTSIKVMLQHH